jgi:uncharacterized membrane protein YgcG
MTPHRLPLLAAAVTAFVLLAAGPASARTVAGTVVDHNSRAHAFVIAAGSGKLTKIYATRSPAVGRSVKVTVRNRSGKLNAVRVRLGARRHRARIRGVVTFADRGGRHFTISASGASIPVTTAPGTAQTPPVGNQVVVVVAVDTSSGDLGCEHVRDLGEHQGEVEIEGIVQSIDTTARTVAISGDEDEMQGGSVTVQFPAAFDMSVLHVGDQVHLKLIQQPDGTFVLRRFEIESEDHSGQQSSGDQGGHCGCGEQSGQGDHSGEGGQSGQSGG